MTPFGAASSRGFTDGDQLGIQDWAEKNPGGLYQKGLEAIDTFLSSREGADLLGSQFNSKDRRRFVAYLTTVIQSQHPLKELPKRDARELRTLAQALDLIGTGDLARAADTLIQRFKAVELKLEDGSWEVGSQLELIPSRSMGLTSQKETHLATRAQMLQLKLDEAKKKAK